MSIIQRSSVAFDNQNMKNIHMIAFLLLVIGGLNWLLVGLFGMGIGDWVGAGLAKVIYILVGLSAIYEIATHKKNCMMCGKGGSGGMMK